MATPPETSQAAQAALAAVLARDVDKAWQLVNPADLQSTVPQLKLAVAALTRKYGLASASLAGQFYAAHRDAAGVTSRYTLRTADPAPIDQVDKSVGWATRGVWQPEPDLASAKTQVAAAADKMVLDTGRQTLIDTVRHDHAAKAWARVPEPGCCYFCAMLATRGAVYKEDTAGFQAHDNCRCHVEPVFTAYEPTAQIRGWQQEWRDVTHGQRNQLLAWRQHFDNRAS